MNEVSEFPFISDVFEMQIDANYTIGKDGNPVIQTATGYSVVLLNNKIGSGSYDYSFISVDAEPFGWMPAKTADGRVLNDKYLNTAGASLDNLVPKVSLLFNEEGTEIFSELTERLIGKQIAIFVGGEMLTAPTVRTKIDQ